MSSSSSLADLAEVLREIDRASPPTRASRGVRKVDHDIEEADTEESNQGHLDSSSSPFSHVEAPSPQAGDPGESKLISLSLPPAVVATAIDQRKYRLWRTPYESEHACYRLIGQGASFCILNRCSTNHKGALKHWHPLPGELFVLKSPSTAFIAPVIQSQKLSETLLKQWFKDSCTIDEWHQRFLLASQELSRPSSREPNESVTDLDLAAKGADVTATLAFKTPARKTRPVTMDTVHDVPEFMEIAAGFDEDMDLHQAIQERFDVVGSTMQTMYLTQQREHHDSIKGLESSDLKLTQLTNIIGDRPMGLDSRYVAPNLWLSIATLADEVHRVAEEQLDLIGHSNKVNAVSSDIQRLESRLNASVPQSSWAILNKQLESLQSFAIDSTRRLNNRISSISSPTGSLKEDDLDQREKVVLKLIAGLQGELSALRANYDAEAIKFGQLGFRSAKECDSWVVTHHPGEDFGLLVDFHLVMEHVHVQMTGQKLISNLEKIYKMALRNNNQALAISSFEARLPRFFSTETRSFVRKDESYFPAIKSWDDWDLPNDGYRDRLNMELQLFKSGHQEILESELTPLSPYYNLCVLALTESVAWIDRLVKFLDDTFNEYSRSRYGPKKAWHITTRLGKALIERVAQPRNSIHNSFKINKPEEVSKSITYASLRSLDVMMKISSVNFKNSPIITAELSKFLALNSNHEVVEKLQSKLTSLESDTSSMKKDVKGAVTAANTAANKWDSTYKSMLDDLKKRVKSLESRG